MGTTYQTVLATGTLDNLRHALTLLRREAYVVPVAEGRWVVLPRGDEHGYADSDELARLLSLVPECSAASFDVHDSDVLTAVVYRGGDKAHSYLSDRSYLIEWWDDDDNECLVSLDGTVYPLDGPLPSPGPDGDDPAAFVPFGVGDVDLVRLHAALRGDVPDDDPSRVRAECRHHEILAALNLDPGPSTGAFRHFEPERFPAAVLVGPFETEPAGFPT
ncbi:hypothetical protein [Plantactinospora sonchi]|uniref:Uncharacterized protein n=1 Tax=Plantactinospora sonchi TaxID=1544735 RepID=A0ABU7RYH6_9ACTN